MSDSPLLQRLSANLESVRSRIESAAARSGRVSAAVQLVAVTKYAPWPAVLGLIALGHRVFGENRPQQLTERAALVLAETPQSPVDWHLIGQLQRNKVRAVLPSAALIHSIDSWRLLERVDQLAAELALTSQVLLQVNISGEDSKGGFSPDELKTCLTQAAALKHVDIRGLMTMAPLTEEEAVVRGVFRGLRELRDNAATSAMPLAELSMGMSGDFEIAIEEGATLVRVGSALFDGCETLS
ncbi:YggS family pyridoxal phosphate-dependent enzyme [Planctomicrobium piriforme]|uniref:Pyridoxal phosphate homeostasis protein n=1 Tax=Planctomicrobium piriforme TaxID=1576369 RepID=A0A1I3HE43_9PLAN|nr:YggS family pyridoxal phosphate-dependent enzyme [Planctomicrobium piriforme]SFI33922.1 hypothetical protein SAMN05421753_10822 [Planctomicrobium piriforme]